MSERYDDGLERQLHDVLPEALPRMEAECAATLRRRVLSAVRSDERTAPWRLNARRAVASFAVVSALLGSVSVAAAVSRPGQPTYALEETFRLVRDAVSPSAAVRRYPSLPPSPPALSTVPKVTSTRTPQSAIEASQTGPSARSDKGRERVSGQVKQDVKPRKDVGKKQTRKPSRGQPGGKRGRKP